jgi:hypothetical protein
MPDPIRIVTVPHRYVPIGHCIYCGTYANKLHKEHILPFGLAGDSLVLPKASCPTCQKETEKVETICLRQLWWPFRTKIGAPTRGKEVPEKFLLRRMRVNNYDRENDVITSYTQLSTDDLKPEEFPLFYLTFAFPPPGILEGRQSSEDVEYRGWCRIDDSEFKKVAARDKEGFRLAPGRPEAVCRMLAKIAHSYAEAEFGSELFKPVLTDYIRGAPTDRLQWVGGCEPIPPATSALHEIEITQETVRETTYLVINIRLFACIGAPKYRVVIGELFRPLNQIPFSAKPIYTVDIEGAIPFRDSQPVIGRVGGGWR